MLSKIAIAVVLPILMGQSPSTPVRGMVEQALDEATTITLQDVTLREAISRLTEATGVPIHMTPEVLALAPHGGETVIERVVISDIPLRRGLMEMFAPLGMTIIVGDGFVEVIPQEALYCLGRAPTWEELETLSQLSAARLGVDDKALASLQGRIQFQLTVTDAWSRLAESIRAVGAGPGDDVLTLACQRIGWAWCLSGDRIVISSVTNLVRRQLQQPIDLRMNSRPLIEILQAIGNRINVAVRAEPGALRSLPLHLQQNASLNVANTPAEQVLDRIAAQTGLGYLVEPDGVLFFNPTVGATAQETPAVASGSSQDDPYVGKIVRALDDGTTVEWLIRRSELPPDLRGRREADLHRAFEALRRQDAGQSP